MKKQFLFSTLVLTILTVSCSPAPVIQPESIKISQDSLTIYVDETSQLTATVLPEKAADKTVTWSVAPQGFASVDANGKVTGIAPGDCTVTATTVNGLTDTCAVKVVPVVTDDIILDGDSGLDFSAGTGTVTAKDGRGNDVIFAFSGASNKETKLVSLEEDGYLSNQSILKGATSIKIEFTGKLFVRYGFITTDLSELVELESGVAVTLKNAKRANYIDLVAGEDGAEIESLEYLIKGSVNNPWDGNAAWDPVEETLTIPQGENWEANTTYYNIPEAQISENFAIEWTMVGDVATTPESAMNCGLILRDEEQTQAAFGINKLYGVVFADVNHWKSDYWINYSSKSYQKPIDNETTFRLERYVFEDMDRAYYRGIVNGCVYEYLGETKASSNFDGKQSKFYNTTLSTRIKLPIVSIGFGSEHIGPMVFKDFRYEVLENAPIQVTIDDAAANSVHYADGESSVYMYNSGKWFDAEGHRPAAIYTEAVPAGTKLLEGEQIVVEADVQRVVPDADQETLQGDGGWNDPHGLLIKEGNLDNKLVVDEAVAHKAFMGIKSIDGGHTVAWGTDKEGTAEAAGWDIDRQFVAMKNDTDTLKYKDVYGRYLEDVKRVRWEITREADDHLRIKMLLQNELGEFVEEENAPTYEEFGETITLYLSANNTSSTYFHNVTVKKLTPPSGCTLKHVPAKAPTCQEAGNIEHYVCTICGKLFVIEDDYVEKTAEEITIPKIEHHFVVASGNPEGDEEHYDEVALMACEYCGQSPEIDTSVTPVIRIDERHLGIAPKDIEYIFRDVHVENDTTTAGPDFHLYSYVTGVAAKAPQVTTLRFEPFKLDWFQPTTNLTADFHEFKDNKVVLDDHTRPSTYDFDVKFTFKGDFIDMLYQLRFEDEGDPVVFDNHIVIYVPRAVGCGEFFDIFGDHEGSCKMTIGHFEKNLLENTVSQELTVDTEHDWPKNSTNPGNRNQISTDTGFVYKDLKVGESLRVVFSENITSEAVTGLDNNYWHYFAYIYCGDVNENLTATTGMSGTGDIGTNAMVCERGNNAEAWVDGEMKSTNAGPSRGRKWVSGNTNITLGTNATVEMVLSRLTADRFTLNVFMKNGAGDTTASASLVGLCSSYVTGGCEVLSFALSTRVATCRMISATITKPALA